MPRTIALHSASGSAAALLRGAGYRIVDFSEAAKPGTKIDAYVYTAAYRPDSISAAEAADISVGSAAAHPEQSGFPVMVNVAGLSAEQTLSTLQYRLGRKDHH